MVQQGGDEDEGGPTQRFEVRLSTQTLSYLKAIKSTGVYGRTATAVVRTEAIDKDYIQIDRPDE